MATYFPFNQFGMPENPSVALDIANAWRTPAYFPDGTQNPLPANNMGFLDGASALEIDLVNQANAALKSPKASPAIRGERVRTEGQDVQSANKVPSQAFAPVPTTAVVTQQAPYTPTPAFRVTPQGQVVQNWVQRPMTNCENGQCRDGMPYTSGISRSAIADADRYGRYGIQTVGDAAAYNRYVNPVLQGNQQRALLEDQGIVKAISDSPQFASLVEKIVANNGGNRQEAQVLALGQLGGEGLVYRMLAKPFSDSQQLAASRANTQASVLNQDAAFQVTGAPRMLAQPDPNTTNVQLGDTVYRLPTLTGGNTPNNLATLTEQLSQTTGQTVANRAAALKAEADVREKLTAASLRAAGLEVQADREARLSTPQPSATKDPELAQLEKELKRVELAIKKQKLSPTTAATDLSGLTVR